MAQRGVIDAEKFAKDIFKIVGGLEKRNNIAMARSINIAAQKSTGIIAKDVAEDHGVAIGTTKRRIQIYKATQYNFRAALIMKDTRITYPKPRQLKHGASFLAKGKKRVKITSPIKMKGTGSKPFVAKLPSGGIPGGPINKRAAVYVIPEAVNKKGSHKKGSSIRHPRQIAALWFSSLPHLARKDWQNKVQKFAMDEIRRIYPKELKTAKRGF